MIHSFKNLKVKFGSNIYICSGKADVYIEDLGNGVYEFWGAKGRDRYDVAMFDNVKLSKYEPEGKQKGEPLQGMTTAEIKLLEDAVADKLAEDNSLQEKYLKDS